MRQLSTIAIVGRPNVGKSALFNRMVGRRLAIVHDQPGVTRDRLTAEWKLEDRSFTLVDTGGIGSHIGDSFDDQVKAEAQLAIELAALILFVVDAQTGLHPIDSVVARELHQTQKPVIVVVNKMDHPKHDWSEIEFSRLGFTEVVRVSAEHGRGLTDLTDAIQQHLPSTLIDAATPDQTPIKLAIVGRPNVGKSSLINAILQDQRTIVSNLAGTTRDAIDVPYERDGRPYLLIDTAGIRPRGKQDNSVEIFSVMRSEKSIERADLCALVIDAVDGVTSQDKKIAGLIQQNEKACLVIINKLDLVKPSTHVRDFFNAVLGQIRSNLFFLNYAPIDILSALTRENLDRLFASIEKVEQHSRKTLGTGQLNRLLQLAMENHPPPMRGNKRLKIMYATQINPERDFQPPTFLLFVNDPENLTDDYRRYLESRIREQLGYFGLPVLFRVRTRH